MLALTYNVNRGPKSKAMRIEDFHPHRTRRRPAMTGDQLHALRPMFAEPKPRPKSPPKAKRKPRRK